MFESYSEKNKCNEIETIRYLFENGDEDHDLCLINNQQHQSFSDKNLLTLNEYLERIRPKLTELMTKHCKVKLNVIVVFRLEKLKNSNDKRNITIKSKDTTDIDEIFSQLIEKHEELSKSLKDTDLISKCIESITYNFREAVIKILLLNLLIG